MKTHWVSYYLPNDGNAIYEDEEWRWNLFGKEHWAGKSYSAKDIQVTVIANDEQVLLISLKYATTVRTYVDTGDEYPL